MSFSFVLGNLVGRALVSYLLVWLVCWCSCRFKAGEAFRRSVRWYSLLAVAALALLGLGAAVSGGAAR
ncbi:hypothetical protein NYO99_19180 [Pelomonas sp. UHG3]|jgi:hypothetical protein|uniref:Uncharacterized protein n=1 Tax=Roseateles hydrophilus TaxID=2975054 RepID=A0ACC6CFG4_9BURK|nr:hypothetical protein [Pelomonas sp. UHG3]MCY4747105.1 hypothetical protein [Pelomonas sp. UHG3]